MNAGNDRNFGRTRASALVLAVLALALAGFAAGRKSVSTDGAPKAIGPYSQGVVIGDLVFVAGQIGVDPATQKLVEPDIKLQTDRALNNIQAILQAAGLRMENVVRTTVYMTDIAEFSQMNETYAHHFTKDPPARSTVQVAALPKAAKIEIDAIAHR